MIISRIKKGLYDIFPSWMVKQSCRNKNYPYALDLSNPRTFNEKIKWMSTHYRNPLYTRCADKVSVQGYVEEKLGKEVADSLFCTKYGVWEHVEDIDIETLPNSFVFKSNHASGHVILCEDKTKLDWVQTKVTLNNWLRTNFFYMHGEWQYKNIKPKIICEELLDADIIDYRIFCFGGKPEYIKVTKHNNESKGGYDCALYYPDWTETEFTLAQNYGYLSVPKPADLDTMLEIARKLSKDFSFVRVDLYSVSGRTYFAELTFTPNSGCEWFTDESVDLRFGEMFKLPKDQYVKRW